MEFLPVKMNGKKVYVGFWKRFLAIFIDLLVLLPVIFLFEWLKSFNITMAIKVAILSSILFSMYHVLFNAYFGGTIGKLAVGIRITKPDGSHINWLEVWKRSSVDLFFTFILLGIQIWTLTQVDPISYISLDRIARTTLLRSYYPTWYKSLINIQLIWVGSEVIVLLLNKRKRAIHDFIAGTVVINKEFAEAVAIYNKLSAQKDVHQLSEENLLDEVLAETAPSES